VKSKKKHTDTRLKKIVLSPFRDRTSDGGAFHQHGAAARDHPADEVQHRALLTFYRIINFSMLEKFFNPTPS